MVSVVAELQYVGGDHSIVILPDGDYVVGRVVVVDASEWTGDDFAAFDDCPRRDRAGLANVISAIRATYDMSVVEITISRNNKTGLDDTPSPVSTTNRKEFSDE